MSRLPSSPEAQIPRISSKRPRVCACQPSRHVQEVAHLARAVSAGRHCLAQPFVLLREAFEFPACFDGFDVGIQLLRIFGSARAVQQLQSRAARSGRLRRARRRALRPSPATSPRRLLAIGIDSRDRCKHTRATRWNGDFREVPPGFIHFALTRRELGLIRPTLVGEEHDSAHHFASAPTFSMRPRSAGLAAASSAPIPSRGSAKRTHELACRDLLFGEPQGLGLFVRQPQYADQAGPSRGSDACRRAVCGQADGVPRGCCFLCDHVSRTRYARSLYLFRSGHRRARAR